MKRDQEAEGRPRACTVLIVDDHPAVRASYQQLLEREPDLRVCGQAASGEAALELLAHLEPDVVLLDFRLPDVEGAELVHRIRTRRPRVRVLVVSGLDKFTAGPPSLAAGAHGFLHKANVADILPDGIRTVARGDRFVDPELLAFLSGSSRSQGLGGDA